MKNIKQLNKIIRDMKALRRNISEKKRRAEIAKCKHETIMGSEYCLKCGVIF